MKRKSNFEVPWVPAPRMEVHAGTYDREKLLDALMDSATDNNSNAMRTGPEGLVRRYLPPGKYSDLYRLYLASTLTKKQPAASSATFYRTLVNSKWRKVLRFRSLTQHAKCSTCHKLKAKLRHSASLQSHAEAADAYQRHLAGQFADRQVYWQLRARATADQDILVAIVDSMDKSKFMLPRYFQGATPKDLETKKRPSAEITCCMCHGRGIFVYVADEEQSSGADWTIEVLAQSLEFCWQFAQRERRPWPSTMRLFADNTPKD